MNGQTKQIAYWGTTGVAAVALGAIGLADLLRLPPILEGLTHLGYPAYFPTILGAWMVLGGAAMLAPGPRLLKEWAYAGVFFTLTGAALSHAASGDPAGKIVLPLAVLLVVGASWVLQPGGSLQLGDELRRHGASGG